MKSGIHPEYAPAKITCACGRATETYTTVGEIHVEICSHCHPFFTGKQKLVDTAGRVERFRAKYGEPGRAAKKARKAGQAKPPEARAAEAKAPVAEDAVVDAPEDAVVDAPEAAAEAATEDASAASES